MHPSPWTVELRGCVILSDETPWAVVDDNGKTVCRCANERTARRIATSENMAAEAAAAAEEELASDLRVAEITKRMKRLANE